MASNGTDSRKTLSKPGLLKEVRAIFERVDDSVPGRKIRLADDLMSGLAIISLKYGSLLKFDRHANEEDTIRFNSNGSNHRDVRQPALQAPTLNSPKPPFERPEASSHISAFPCNRYEPDAQVLFEILKPRKVRRE